MHFKLNINYTLMVLPEKRQFHWAVLAELHLAVGELLVSHS